VNRTFKPAMLDEIVLSTTSASALSRTRAGVAEH